MDMQALLHQGLLSLHLVGVAFGLGGAFMADFTFFKGIRQADRISPETVRWMGSFSQVVWIGIGLLTLSGSALVLMDPSSYLASGGFVAKMFLVVILIVNGFLLSFYSTKRLTTFNFSQKYAQTDTAWRARKLSFIFGAVSAVTWYTILGIAMFKELLSLPAIAYLGGYFVLLGGAMLGSLALEKLLYTRAQTQVTAANIDSLPIEILAAYPAQSLEILRNRQ